MFIYYIIMFIMFLFIYYYLCLNVNYLILL